MNDDDARRLAHRCVDTWPTGPKAYVWRDTLAELDHDLATAAYRTLERDAERAPTPGMFHAAYRGAAAASRRTTLEPPPSRCQLCDGTGWVDAPPLITTVNGQPHEYTQLQPCRGDRLTDEQLFAEVAP